MNAKTIKITEPSRAVVTRKPREVEPSGDPMMRLLQAAVDQNFEVEKLAQLIALKNAEEDRKAKREYDEHFAAMQREFVAVKRTKDVEHKYKYAPIEELQKSYGPIIAQHGFSYRWYEQAAENGSKRCILRISGWGHSEENFFDIPNLDSPKNSSGKDVINPVQIAGAMSTYGRRYTFIAGFGVIIEDEDNDGTFDQGVKYGPQITLIDESKTLAELSENWKTILPGLSADIEGKRFLYKRYESRKLELLG